jgi:hypothetical protein
MSAAELRTEGLSPDDLIEIDQWKEDFKRINDAPYGQTGKIVKAIADRRGCAESNVRNKKKAFEKQGVVALLDSRKKSHRKAMGEVAKKEASIENSAQSLAFRNWVKDIARKCQRSLDTPTVRNHVLEHWQAAISDPLNPVQCATCDVRWGEIPGYEKAPQPDRANGDKFPRGWSLRSFQNILSEMTDYDKAFSKEGPLAAMEHLAPVLTTRAGLRPGEIYMVDDNWHNVTVRYGNRAGLRPLGLNTLDLHSGCDVSAMFKLRDPSAEKGERGLNQKDMVWHCVHNMTYLGFLPDAPTYKVTEAGTASAPKVFQDALSRAVSNAGGELIWHVGEVSKALVKGLPGLRKGNPKFKAARESLFNLMQNRTALLPGQLGLDYKSTPEQMTALVRQEQKTLNMLSDHLTMEEIAWLNRPTLSIEQFVPLMMKIYQEVNDRKEHNLEGWHECGYVIEEYFHPNHNEWIPALEFDALPQLEQQGIFQLVAHEPAKYSRSRKLSPLEVWNAGKRHLKTISPHVWHQIVPVEFAEKRTLPKSTGTRFTLTNRKEFITGLTFETFYTDYEGKRHNLPAGKDVFIYLNPQNVSEALFTLAENNEPLGIVRTLDIGTRLETDLLLAQYGEREAQKKLLEGGAYAYEKAQVKKLEVNHEKTLALVANHSPEETAERIKAQQILDRDKKPALGKSKLDELEDEDDFTPPAIQPDPAPTERLAETASKLDQLGEIDG